jgi:hypothetical protein
MSVTVERQPEDFQPVFNQNRWIVESNNTAQTNFEYICDVYVNAGATYIARLKRFPDSDGYGDFDLSRVLADYVSVTLAASNDNGFNLHRSHYVNYVLKFGEIYNGTTYTNLTVTSSQVALMMALSFNQFYDYDYEQYASGVGSPSVDIKFLTNSPRTLKARRNGYAELHFLNATTSNSSYLKINSYLPSGSLIASYTIANPYVTVNVNNKWLSVGVGIYNLNTATLSSGVQLVVDDDAGSYDVALYDTSNNRTSEIITFEIDDTCNRYDGKHIKFLNRLGGFDTFFFSSNENVFIDVNNREQYTKLAGTVSGSPVTWGYNLSDRGQKVIAVDSQERTILKSGALTDAEYVWLRELITSPEVYAVETYNGTIYDRPIVITTSSYEEVYKRNKKMSQLTLEYKYAHKENIQML